VNKQELLQRFAQLVGEMERNHSWGKLEVGFQNGRAETIRKEVMEKLNKGTTYGQQKEYR